ncbi:MAG: DNA polymerase IV [Bacteroidota bacterium]
MDTNFNRSILHMDVDAFFVAVECLRDDRLRGIPLIIGGKDGRGVVTSCSYEARKFGVHSAMPTRLALRLCPDAKVISGDMEAYSYHSKMVTEIIAEEAPVFEKSSIDEFYVDASGMDRFFGTFKWAMALRQRIKKQTGLPISTGLAVNKLVAKVATGENKPDGEGEVLPGLERSFLAPLPVRKIPMIGPKTTQFLAEMGITHVHMLRQMPIKLLERSFGKHGRALWMRANGIDHTPVAQYSERKSISTECTFHQDSIDVDRMKSMLTAMVEKLCHQLREEEKLASCVTVKIRYANFDTETKQRHLPYTSNDRHVLTEVLDLYEKLYTRRMLLRLVGVRLSGLIRGHYQIDMFEDSEDSINLYQAMDAIKTSHGPHAIVRASTLGLDSRIRTNTNAFQG